MYPHLWTLPLTRYLVADTVGTPQLDLWGLPLCQVCSLLSTFHVYAIELSITTVSVCHLCLAQPCLRVSFYTSGLISVLPSHTAQRTHNPEVGCEFSMVQPPLPGNLQLIELYSQLKRAKLLPDPPHRHQIPVLQAVSTACQKCTSELELLQKCQKHIGKDVGFSSCTPLPLYHVSLYLQKGTEVWNEPEWFWRWDTESPKFRVEGWGSEFTEWGLGLLRVRFRFQINERYIGMWVKQERQWVDIWTTGGTGERSKTLYSRKHQKKLRLMSWNGARKAVQDFRTTRQLEDNKKWLEQQEQGQMER